jgi:hypothetical protein
MTTLDRPDIARPTVFRRIWIPGIQYEGETAEQMQAREDRYRAEDAAAAAELERLWRWKCRPWWE